MPTANLHLRDRSESVEAHAAWRAPSLLVLLTLAALLLAGLGLLTACGGAGTADDGVAVRVNGSPVTEDQVETARAEARLSGSTDDRETALEEAIRRELVRQEATRLKVTVGEDDLEERLDQVRDRAGGADALAAALEQVEMSQAQLSAAAEYGLLRESVGDAKYPDLAATDEKTAAFYEKHREDLFTHPASVKLSSIQVPTRWLAENALAELREGVSFELTARKYSRDPDSKANGGRLGWILESTLPAPLVKAVREMEVGETSAPVGANGGWYVLRLQDRREERVTPFAEVRRDLQDQLTGRLRLDELDEWLEQARSRAIVERVAG